MLLKVLIESGKGVMKELQNAKIGENSNSAEFFTFIKFADILFAESRFKPVKNVD